MPKGNERATPLVLYVITEDWFFASHFLPMARVAQALGYETAVVTRVGAAASGIEAAGVRVIPFDFARGGIAPFRTWLNIRRLRRIFSKERPALIHCIALQAILIGARASKRIETGKLFAVTGLGHNWVARGIRSAALRALVRWNVARMRAATTVFLFENRDDPSALGLHPEDGDVAFVPGAGVDPADFPPMPPPEGQPIRVAVVARMLWAKGIGTAVEAVRHLRAEGADVALDLWGAPDPANPGSIAEEQLAAWNDEHGVTWHGPTDDVGSVWAATDIALLPSHYREGTPKTLVEAMACARPVVTTDVPGCRDLVRDGIDGYVVPKQDAEALARAIGALASSAELRQTMGAAALQRFRQGYTADFVAERIAELYRRLV